MKTQAPKSTSPALQPQKGSRSFFHKEGEGAFFVKDQVQLKAGNEHQSVSSFFGSHSGITPFFTPSAAQLQKKEEPKRETRSEILQLKPIFDDNGNPEEEGLQRKCTACQAGVAYPRRIQMQGGDDAAQASPGLESRLNAARGGGSPLPGDTRSSMESAFGADFGNVRVHTDNGAVQMNEELGAQAFTHGADVYFNKGKYSPQTTQGQELLGHELTHVVQQGAGQVRETMQAAGLPVNDDAGLEKEADEMGGKVVQKKGHENGCVCAECLGTVNKAEPDATTPPLQRKPGIGLAIQLRPSNVVNHTFLGVPVAGGVHTAMRARLRLVEAELQREYDILLPSASGGSLRNYAGLQSITGWQDRAGNHGTGRAVDVNYLNQPYIATRTTEGSTTTFGGEEGGATAATRALRRPAVEVYDRAVSFVNGESDTADVSNRREGESAGEVYDRFRTTSDALATYFSLAFKTDYHRVTRPPIADPEATSEADLLRIIPTDERKEESAAIAAITAYMQNDVWQLLHPNFPSPPPATVYRERFIRILRDFEIVRKPMQRGNPSTRPGDTRNPALGFLHMPRHFVVAMMDVGGLRWGACEFSAASNGDIHHFDLTTAHHMPAPAPTPVPEAESGAAPIQEKPIIQKRNHPQSQTPAPSTRLGAGLDKQALENNAGKHLRAPMAPAVLQKKIQAPVIQLQNGGGEKKEPGSAGTARQGAKHARSALKSLSNKQLLEKHRTTQDARVKAAVLKVLQENNPNKSYLGKIYKVAEPAEVLKQLSTGDPDKNKFASGPDVEVGQKYEIKASELLPHKATVKILTEAQEFKSVTSQVAVAQVEVTAVEKEKDNGWVGKAAWTTRTNVSNDPDAGGNYTIIAKNGNVRKAPTAVQGKQHLAVGKEVYIYDVKVDNLLDRKTFGLAVDAVSGAEYGWINTAKLEGKMVNEVIGRRTGQYENKTAGHDTIGARNAYMRVFKGHHYALQKELIPINTLLKIQEEKEHYQSSGKFKVAKVVGKDGKEWGWTTRSNVSKAADKDGFHKIIKGTANVRLGPVEVFASTGKKIPQGTFIKVQATKTAGSLLKNNALENIALSKVTAFKKDGTNYVENPDYKDVWTASSNLVEGWADIKAPTAMWKAGSYIGQTDIVDIIGDIVDNPGRRQIAAEAADNIIKMLRAAEKDGVNVYIQSGYRDYVKQKQLDDSPKYAAADPGYSKHQQGKAYDLNNKKDEAAYNWLRQNAWKYGLVQNLCYYNKEGHHWEYDPAHAQSGYYTYFKNGFGYTFPNENERRVPSNKKWTGYGKPVLSDI